MSLTNIFYADIRIKEGEIVSISKDLNIGKRDIDATGKYVLPSGVDTHCHIEHISRNGLKMQTPSRPQRDKQPLVAPLP